MKLQAESILHHPRDVVFATYRDRLPDLVPYLPNVRGIEVKSRSDEGDKTRLVNIWHGGGEIPAAVRSIVSDKMLSWTDHALWLASEFACEWRIEAHSFTEAIRSAGKNRFLAVDGGTKLIIEGELTVDGKKLPIPRLLAGAVAGKVESFLVSMIRPNLVETANGVAKFLDAQAKKA